MDPHTPVPSRMNPKHLLLIALVAVLLVGGGVALGLYLRGSPAPGVPVEQSLPKHPSTSQTPSSDSNPALSDIQRKARDTQRKTNITSIASQLEVYYNDNASYPDADQLSDDSWVSANMPDVELYLFRAPSVTNNSFVGSETPTKDQFGYIATDSGGKPCKTAPCSGYTLYWYSEASGTVISKVGLNYHL